MAIIKSRTQMLITSQSKTSIVLQNYAIKTIFTYTVILIVIETDIG